MDAAGYRFGLTFLIGLVLLAFLVFAWYSYEELIRKKRHFGKLRYLVPNAFGIILFLSAAFYTVHFFLGWAERGFAVALP